MNPIKISNDDISTGEDFVKGNPIQVRVLVRFDNDAEYQKGKSVTVLYDNRQLEATIVSDPLVISEDPEKQSKILSLIVEQKIERT